MSTIVNNYSVSTAYGFIVMNLVIYLVLGIYLD